ncbi:hypothetical protein [Carboxylicivirga sp. RSCT41]|uniref:hypothetical protein n=1 Tax=Carboxylicivirga agarovorans TaxID=3417570 RepID=UPI003D3388CD
MSKNYVLVCDICHISSKALFSAFDLANRDAAKLTVMIIYNKTSLYFGDYGSMSSPLYVLEKDLLELFKQRYKYLSSNDAQSNDINNKVEIRFVNNEASLKPYIDTYSNWVFEHKSLATRLNPGGLLNKLNTKKRSVQVVAKNGKLIDLHHASFFNFSFIQNNRLFWDNSPLELGML